MAMQRPDIEALSESLERLACAAEREVGKCGKTTEKTQQLRHAARAEGIVYAVRFLGILNDVDTSEMLKSFELEARI